MDPTFIQAVRDLARKTSGGVRRARVIAKVGDNAAVQTGSQVVGGEGTTDEAIFQGDTVWVQPVAGRAGSVAVHGRA